MSTKHPGVHLGVIALVLALAYGIWYAYSVFLVALLRDFGWKRSLLAGAFSTFAIVQGVVNPVLGSLCDRVSPAVLMGLGGLLLSTALVLDSFITLPWHLYVAFGGMTALGVALCGWIPSLVLVQRRYARRLGLAIGIISAGVGVGMLAVVPLAQWLIDLHGWRSAFRWLAAATALCVLPAALFLYLSERNTPESALIRAGRAAPARAQALGPILRNPSFWLLVLAFFGGTYCSQTLHVHQVAFLVDHGITPLQAASVVGVVGLASIFGKIGSGWLSDHFVRERVYCGFVAILLLAVAALAFAGAKATSWSIYAYAILLGVGYSATAAITPAMMSDRFSGPRFGTIIGMGLFASALGSASGPWMAGHLFDLEGSYTTALWLAGGAGSIACLCGWHAGRMRNVIGRPQR